MSDVAPEPESSGPEPHEMPVDESRPEEENPDLDSAGPVDDGVEN